MLLGTRNLFSSCHFHGHCTHDGRYKQLDAALCVREDGEKSQNTTRAQGGEWRSPVCQRRRHTGKETDTGSGTGNT